MTFKFKNKLKNIFTTNLATIATNEYGNIEVVNNTLIIPMMNNVTYRYDLTKHTWRKNDNSQILLNISAPLISLVNTVVYDPILFECFEYYKKTDDEILEYKNTYYRELRSKKCFSVINRGQLWYDRLKQWQLNELSTWYSAWLNITNTYVIPTEPSWLNSKLNDLEDEII